MHNTRAAPEFEGGAALVYIYILKVGPPLSMHWKVRGGQFSKNPIFWEKWGAWTPQLLWWHRPCIYNVFVLQLRCMSLTLSIDYPITCTWLSHNMQRYWWIIKALPKLIKIRIFTSFSLIIKIIITSR